MNNQKVWIGLVMTLLLIAVVIGIGEKGRGAQMEEKTQKANRLDAEQFLIDHLMNRDGRLRTNLVERKNIFLSETVGLWMEYLLVKDDPEQFSQQVRVLEKYFLTKDYLVAWMLEKKEAAKSNASIDDLRIMNALFVAGEQWEEPLYTALAEKMANELGTYQIRKEFMVDYINLDTKEQGSVITLSYVIPEAFDRLKENKSITQEVYDNTYKLLTQLPHSPSGFFPKSYDVKTKQYSYDEEVNLIDQYYIGYHRTQWNGDVTQLLNFTKRELLKHDGRLFGVYDLENGEPLVMYEAASVYSLAILMCFQIDEFELAGQLFTQMKMLQQNDMEKKYYGGYIDLQTLDTHTFDNILALIAERIGADENIF